MSRARSDEELVRAVRDSVTIAGVLRALGLQPVGGNYRTIHNAVHRLQLDTSHWLGQAHLAGKKHPWPKLTSLRRILTRNSSFKTYHLKVRLLKENLLDNRCYRCGLTEWLGQPISLHLDHKNGI